MCWANVRLCSNAINIGIDTIRDLYEQNKSICDELDIDEKRKNLFYVESNLKEGKIQYYL
ncbi:MAG: hypothetical protein ACLRPW_00545 [Intestinibacter sp.]